MKLNEQPRDILTNTQGSQAFQIEANALMFQMLSSGVYQNKIKAIIRELSCNAYDSHVMLGEPQKKFQVHLPNAIEPWFEVKDFGVGLSEQQVYELYTVYGRSNKRDSNDIIGGLGIGSKSPFSYTDQFSVESIYDGVKTIYNAFVGTDGSPQITKVHSYKTDDHNGVAVKVPVKTEDFHRFTQEAREVFCWFDVIPEIVGATVEIESVVEDSEYFLVNKGYKNIYVLMGNVAYSYNMDMDDYPLIQAYCGGKSLVVKFDIGSLSVAASRETLSLDKMTENNLKSKFDNIESSILKDIQKKIDESGNIYNSTHRDYTWFLENKSDVLTFKGNPLDDYRVVIDEDSEKLFQIIFKRFNTTSVAPCYPSQGSYYKPWYHEKINMLVEDSDKYKMFNIRRFFDEHRHSPMFLVKPENLEEVTEMFQHFECNIEYLSERIANGCKPERKPRGQSQSGITLRIIEDGKVTGEKMTKKAIKDWVNEQEDAVYVKAVDFRSSDTEDIIESLADIIDDAVILLVSESFARELIEKTSAVSLKDYQFSDETSRLYDNYSEYYDCRMFFNSLRATVRFDDDMVKIIEQMEGVNLGKLKKALEFSKEPCVSDRNFATIRDKWSIARKTKVFLKDDLVNDCLKLVDGIKDNYPLISFKKIYEASGDHKLTTEIEDYILMKNQKMKQEEAA